MLPGKKYTPEDVLRIAMQRKWLILVPFVIGVVASVLAAQRVAKLYKSETLIMVVPQRVPSDYVKTTDATRIEDRLRSISEEIQSRSRLERIINDFNLYAPARARGGMEDAVQRLRENIDIGPGGTGQESFRLSYVNSDPELARKVTERLASWFIEQSTIDRQKLSATTNEFLEGELEKAKRSLLEHEKKLESYRRQYSGQLPSQLEANLQSIQNTQVQLQSISDSINRARERRLLIERQLADAQMFPAASADVPANSAQEPQALTSAQQLEAAEASLDRARLRYTPDHPDIRALERTIRELQAKMVADAERPQPQARKLLSPSEAARQKRIKDYEAEIEVIDRQIAASDREQSRLRGALASYQAKVDAVPTRESELVELTRDYGTLQANYTSLLTKREDSKLAANLERRQIGEQFKVLDPPSLPEKPVNAKTRVMLMVGGSAGGLMLGLLAVGFLEYRDTSFKTEADVTRVLALPVLALVPLMEEGQSGSKRQRRFLGLVTTTVAVGAAAARAYWRQQF
ncbi:MAG: hypothetical protein ABIS06_04880 [Vicinamibacterales bacterium]